MTGFTPSRNSGEAERTLANLASSNIDPAPFTKRIQRLQNIFSVCPPFIAGHGLQVNSEITYQCEQWLPLDELQPAFYQFYRHALSYPPVFSSTPFADAASWAGIVSRFPPFLRHFINPARLLQQLLVDDDLRLKFLFWSFMPERYYGDGSNRYPEQAAVIGDWLRRRNGCVRCLDAACGDGAASYGLARLLLEQGWHKDRFKVEGWTLDPLEAWSAANGLFQHNPQREAVFRVCTAPVFDMEAASSMLFRNADLMAETDKRIECFDLIICNGLLGGPIINRAEEIKRIVFNLCALLAPGGMLLAADHFHGGWKKKSPRQELRAFLELNGLLVTEAAEGLSALKLNQ